MPIISSDILGWVWSLALLPALLGEMPFGFAWYDSNPLAISSTAVVLSLLQQVPPQNRYMSLKVPP